ncbi:MAG TPA: hypothetical protein GX708_07775, partial [Gallicola sp.]|nr:hypothetical protein [Gallicola sp.]
LLKADIQNKIVVKYEGYIGRILYNVLDYKKGKYRNSRVIINKGSSLYFRQTIKNTMYLTVREPNIYDSKLAKLKVAISKVMSKFVLNNNIILLYEKNANSYEESASILYEQLIDEGYTNCYYILDKNNSKFKELNNKYKKNIINKNSFKHLIYFFKSEKFIGTETLTHVIQLRVANRNINRKLNSKNISYVFLQHGIMYMISLDSEMRTGFHKKNYKLHRVVASSKLEAKHFVELGGFNKSDIYITGLAKFDKNHKNKTADKIVVMPTWRRWELNEARQDFTKTGYHNMIETIIDSIPIDLLQKTIVLPHPLIINYFKESNSNLKYYLPKEISYNEILKDCKLLITDYSSISFDAFYRGSNVIFYWRDKEKCLRMYGDKTKLLLNKENVFGDICYTKKELATSIINSYTNEQQLKHKKRYEQIVEFDDNKNTQRIIQKLKEDKVI